MSCIVPNTPPLTGYGPRAHCALNSTFTLHSQLRICELLAISLRTAQPSLAPPRRHVIASITRSRTSPRSISLSRQFAVSQTRFVCSSLNSSSPHSSCFCSQQLRYQTEQLVPFFFFFFFFLNRGLARPFITRCSNTTRGLHYYLQS